MSLSELADHIVATHHTFLRQELPRLAGLLAKVARAHGLRHPELRDVGMVFVNLKEELESHMFKEEAVLFPMIKRLEAGVAESAFHCGGVDNPIRVMEHEHASAGAALERLRALTSGYQPPADACATFRALLGGLADLEVDLHWHVHKENNILFPKASALEASLQAVS